MLGEVIAPDPAGSTLAHQYPDAIQHVEGPGLNSTSDQQTKPSRRRTRHAKQPCQSIQHIIETTILHLIRELLMVIHQQWGIYEE
jgi:hypothetical protein